MDEEISSSLTTSDPIELATDMKKMVEAGSDYLVMEVSSHALDQSRVSGFEFDVAVFTNLSHDHLDYHTTIEAYANAKKKLFDGLTSSATAIINADDSYGELMVSESKAKKSLLSFVNGKNSIQSNSADGLEIVVDDIKISSPLIGEFNAYNLAQAYLVCRALNIESEHIVSALKSCSGAAGRMEKVIVDSAPIVIVDYAHTPDALHNVLSTLSTVKENDQKLTVVFGAGGNRDTTKRPEMAKAAESFADKIFVTSDNPRFENPDLIIAEILDGFENLHNVVSITNREDAIFKAIEEAGEQDIILIAGKGHEDYQDVKGTKYPFDDRLIAKEALEQFKMRIK